MFRCIKLFSVYEKRIYCHLLLFLDEFVLPQMANIALWFIAAVPNLSIFTFDVTDP